MVQRLILVSAVLFGSAFLAPVRADDKDEIDRLSQRVQALEKQVKDLTAANRKLALDAKLAALDARAAEALSEVATALAEQKSRAADQVIKLAAEAKKLADERMKLAEEGLKLAEEKSRLAEQLAAAAKKQTELNRELMKLLEGRVRPAVVTELNPPKNKVTGKVTAVDARTGVVTIAVGKDAGLEKGHTLDVYRLKPQRAQIGVLTIIEVKKNEATGKLLGQDAPAVQVDDVVDSAGPAGEPIGAPSDKRPANEGSGVRRDNPPKEKVKGKVTAIDEKTGVVTISVGKDAGLEKDHTLQVYRLKPKPAYLGTLRIIEVEKNQATGKMTLRVGKDMPGVQVGDEVASSILD